MNAKGKLRRKGKRKGRTKTKRKRRIQRRSKVEEVEKESSRNRGRIRRGRGRGRQRKRKKDGYPEEDVEKEGEEGKQSETQRTNTKDKHSQGQTTWPSTVTGWKVTTKVGRCIEVWAGSKGFLGTKDVGTPCKCWQCDWGEAVPSCSFFSALLAAWVSRRPYLPLTVAFFATLVQAAIWFALLGNCLRLLYALVFSGHVLATCSRSHMSLSWNEYR